MARSISLSKEYTQNRWWLKLLPSVGFYIILVLLWNVQAHSGTLPNLLDKVGFYTLLAHFWDMQAHTGIPRVLVELVFYAILMFVAEMLVRDAVWIKFLRPFGFFFILLLFWDGLARSGIWASFLFVGPVDVWQALVTGFQDFGVNVVFTFKGVFVLVLLALLGVGLLLKNRLPKEVAGIPILFSLTLFFLTTSVSTGFVFSDIAYSLVLIVPVLLAVGLLTRGLLSNKLARLLIISSPGLFILGLVPFALFFPPAPVWSGPQNVLSVLGGLVSIAFTYLFSSIGFVYGHHLLLIVLALFGVTVLSEGLVSKSFATIFLIFFFSLFFLTSTVFIYQASVFVTAILTSATRLDIGYFTSVLLGVSLGLLIGLNRSAKETLGSLVLGLQALPSVCWIPLALLWFGLSENAMYFVVVMGALFSIIVGVEAGVRHTPPVYIKAARNMGASGIRLALLVVLPAALPSIVVGLKQGWTFAWRSLMAAELLYVTVSLGGLLEESRQNIEVPQMFGVMVLIIIIGVLIDSLVFGPLERTLRLRWGFDQ